MAERGKGGLRGGFRVFRVHVDNENLPKLRQLFRDFVDGCARVKGVLYYRDVWLEVWQNVLKMREEAGRRTVPNPPAALLLVRFAMPDGNVRGNKNAPCIVDLRRSELRIPSYNVKVPLRGSLAKALVEENNLEPRPDFVLQVTRKGFVRIIACREAYSALYLERLESMYEESDDVKYKMGRLATEYRGFMKRHLGFLLNSPVPQWGGEPQMRPASHWGSSARDRGGSEPRQRADPMTPRASSSWGAVRGTPTKMTGADEGARALVYRMVMTHVW